MKRKWNRGILLVLCMFLALQLTLGAASGSEIAYPIVTDGSVTLDIWMPLHTIAAKFIETFADNESFQEVMKKTGIALTFTHPAANQEQEQFNLMVASGDLSDIIVSNRYQGGEAQGVTDGLFVDLTELVPQHAPDYHRLFEDDDFRKMSTDDQGRIVAFYAFKDPGIEVEWRRPILRKDWLDEFGLDVPKTLDDYEVYFQKVLEIKNVTPYMLPKTGVEAQLLGAFDVGSNFFPKDGKITHFYIEEGLREYLECMNAWYAAGYISKDFTTGNANKEFTAQKLGMDIAATINGLIAAKGVGYEIASAPYPRKTEDQQIHTGFIQRGQNGYPGCISTRSPHIVEAVQFLNYGYTPEGRTVYGYGVEGTSWINVDGQPAYTDYMLKNEKYSLTDVDYVLRLHTTFPFYRDLDKRAIPANVADPETVAIREVWSDDPLVDTDYLMPPVLLSQDESTERSKIMSDISTYADEMILKFIVGAEPLSGFDGYVAQIKAMGMERAIELTQAAYDRYMAK